MEGFLLCLSKFLTEFLKVMLIMLLIQVSSLDYDIRFGQIASQLEKKNLLLRKIIITETMTIKILLLLLL